MPLHPYSWYYEATEAQARGLSAEEKVDVAAVFGKPYDAYVQWVLDVQESKRLIRNDRIKLALGLGVPVLAIGSLLFLAPPGTTGTALVFTSFALGGIASGAWPHFVRMTANDRQVPSTLLSTLGLVVNLYLVFTKMVETYGAANPLAAGVVQQPAALFSNLITEKNLWIFHVIYFLVLSLKTKQ